jgi:hypothetical protein
MAGVMINWFTHNIHLAQDHSEGCSQAVQTMLSPELVTVMVLRHFDKQAPSEKYQTSNASVRNAFRNFACPQAALHCTQHPFVKTFKV